ncbi:MAG: THUMP-like domain-containing protein [Bacteroidia bacterium]
MSTDQNRISVLSGSQAKEFLQKHAQDKPETCLNAAIKFFGADAKWVLEQLHLQQKAAKKIPLLQARSWLLTTKSFEQCTPEAVARYKAGLFAGDAFTDLCAGAGVDAWYAGFKHKRLVLVEADETHANLLKHNFKDHRKAQILHTTAEKALDEIAPRGCVYLDPDRRPGGKRVFDFSQSQPDLLQMLPRLLLQFDQIFIKGSPMLDISACIKQLPHIKNVYAICLHNELKELLFELEPGYSGIAQQQAILLDDQGQLRHQFDDTQKATPAIAQPKAGQFFYEPHAGLIKTRLDRAHAAQNGLCAMNAHAAWFVGDEWVPDYPGRIWKIEAVLSYKPKRLKQQLLALGIQRAHIAKRDFGLEVAAIRQRLNMAEGEDAQLCFTKSLEGEGLCVVCKKCG